MLGPRATHSPTSNEFAQFVRSRGAASILETITAATELAAFWGIDSEQSHAMAVNFNRVAIDDGRNAN
ncbi:hypothetical protein TM239_41120 [Bradyrhizobium sp. TM239]|nr:hypothetical protein TM239_41120 [Bradyrhizobium sp. TM239]